MNSVSKLIYLLLIFSLHSSLQAQDGNFFGLSIPNKAEKFANKIISVDQSIEFSLSIDFKGQIYYTKRTGEDINRIYTTKLREGKFSTPTEVCFTKGIWANHPFISADGQKLFFGSKFSLENPDTACNTSSSWFIEKVNNKWSKSKYLGDHVMKVSCSLDGTLYYSDKSKGFSACRIAKMEASVETFKDLGKINLPDDMMAAHPAISPNGDYLIFDSYLDQNYQNSDLFICFKKDDQSWSKAINIGAIVNTKGVESCANISPDGKVLFFTRWYNEESDIYWIGMEEILRLKTLL